MICFQCFLQAEVLLIKFLEVQRIIRILICLYIVQYLKWSITIYVDHILLYIWIWYGEMFVYWKRESNHWTNLNSFLTHVVITGTLNCIRNSQTHALQMVRKAARGFFSSPWWSCSQFIFAWCNGALTVCWPQQIL